MPEIKVIQGISSDREAMIEAKSVGVALTGVAITKLSPFGYVFQPGGADKEIVAHVELFY